MSSLAPVLGVFWCSTMGSNLALFDGGVVGQSSDGGFLRAFGSAVVEAVSSISLVATALIAVLLLSERLETMIHRGKCSLCGRLASIYGQNEETVRKITVTLLVRVAV